MNKMHVVVMLVTPEMATEWLKKNFKNRAISQTNVIKYVNDILNGRWFLTHQGVAFDTDGNLRDGQHRLFAISIAEKSVSMAVAFNVPKEAFIAVDNGKTRSVSEHETYIGNPLPKEYMPTLRGMMFGEGRRLQISSNTGWSSILHRYDAAVRFAINCFGQDKSIVGLKNGTIMGPVARAYYSQDNAKLKQFAEILTSGIPKGGIADETILRFRNWRLAHPEMSGGVLYRKTERTIQAFLNGERLDKIYEPTEELFPIPSLEEEEYITDVRSQIKQLQQLLSHSESNEPNAIAV